MRYTVQTAHGGRVAPARAVAHMRRTPGMGQAPVQVATYGVATAGTIMSGLAVSAAAASSASVAAGGAASTAFLASSLAIPVIGAVVAGVTLALMAIFSRKGPKQKVATTEVVNKVEPLMQENLAGYIAGPRTRSSQEQALENFKAGWQFVVDNCDVPVMGNPGQECVNDRNRGGEWDWWSYYYDPIANDPDVKPDPTDVILGGSTVDGGTAAGSGSPVSLPETVAGLPTGLLLAGVALVAALTMGGDK